MAEEKNNDTPELSPLAEAFENRQKEAAKATYGDVIKSGGIRILAGPAQAFLGSAETAGLVDKGSTANFTRAVLEAEKMGEMDLAQTLVRDTLAQGIPIAAEIYATRGRTLLQSLKPSAAIGGMGGYYTFVEDPEQAAGVSSARMYNMIIGAVAGPATLAVMGPTGKLLSSIPGIRGALDVAGPDIRPSEAVRETGAELIEAAGQRGITISPGVATNDAALVAEELRRNALINPVFARFLGDKVGSNATSLEALIDDLVNTILPEGKEQIGKAIDDAYIRVDVEDRIPQESLPLYDTLRNEDVVQKAISNIKNTTGLSSEFNNLHPLSVGRINMIVKNLEAMIESAPKDAAQKMIAAKRRLQEFGDNVSPSYKEARAMTQRKKTALTVEQAMQKGGDGVNPVVPYQFRVQSFVNAFENLEAKKALDTAIENLPSGPAQKEARAKFNMLIELIPRVAEMDKLIKAKLGDDPEELSRRAGITPAATYSFLNFLNINNDRKFIEFILDPNKSVARLREIMPKRNTAPEEFLRTFGIWVKENFDEYGDIITPPEAMSKEEEDRITKASTSSKSKTYQRLLRSGKLEELREKNPRVYEQLLESTRQTAIV